MKEIALTPKAEAGPEAIRDYSFSQFGCVQADEFIGRIDLSIPVISSKITVAKTGVAIDSISRRPRKDGSRKSIPAATLCTPEISGSGV